MRPTPIQKEQKPRCTQVDQKQRERSIMATLAKGTQVSSRQSREAGGWGSGRGEAGDCCCCWWVGGS